MADRQYDACRRRVFTEGDVAMNERPLWQHKKRGSVVRELGRGFAQVSAHPIEEMTAVVIYEHMNDGSLWVRNAVEFDDGRFEPLSPSNPHGVIMPLPITHDDLKVLRDTYIRTVNGDADDQDVHIAEWLSELLAATAPRPNWPHTITLTPQESVSGYVPTIQS